MRFKTLFTAAAAAALLCTSALSAAAAPANGEYDSFTNETGTYTWSLSGTILEGSGTSGALTAKYGSLNLSINGSKKNTEEYVKDGTVRWNGGNNEAYSLRYIEYTPEYDGTLKFTITGEVDSLSSDVTVASWSDGTATTVENITGPTGNNITDASVSLTAGKTYRVYPTNTVTIISDISYTVDTKKVMYKDSPEKIDGTGEEAGQAAFYGEATVGSDVDNVGFTLTKSDGTSKDVTYNLENISGNAEIKFGLILTDWDTNGTDVTVNYYTGE